MMSLKQFLRPCWLTLLISIVLVPLGNTGTKVTPFLFRMLHIPYTEFGPLDLVDLALALWVIVGWLGMSVSAIWCLADAAVLHIRSNRFKQEKP
jgi:hypothetical protein